MSAKLWSRVLSIVVVALFLSPGTWAQHASKATGPKYDKTTEVKITGVVEEIRDVPGEFEGTHLVVKCADKTVLVHLAPGGFLKELDTSFKAGDQVTVVGAKAPDTNAEEILAREITVGNNTTTLRDDKGIPVWAGWKPVKSTGD
jgi:23S rRNA U2552 (ribose-2'-O)-methylase RlmE/FtsJ